MRIALLVALLALVPACGSVTAGRVRAQHAALSGCPENQVYVQRIDASTYVAEGCGLSASYFCPEQRGWRIGRSCVPSATYER